MRVCVARLIDVLVYGAKAAPEKIDVIRLQSKVV